MDSLHLGSVTCAEIAEKFPNLISEVVGDASRRIDRATTTESADAASAVFISAPRFLDAALNSAAQVFIISPQVKAELDKYPGNTRTLLIAKNVDLALALITNDFFQATPYTNKKVTGVHPTAIVDESASLGRGVRIGPNAFIGAGVRLGDDVFIGANSVIEDDCQIGAETVVHPLVYVGPQTEIGRRCEIHSQSAIGKEGFKYAHNEKGEHVRVPHQGIVVLEDNVHIGSLCAIDRGTFKETRIGAGTKIDNSVHIAHNCTIGRNGLITAGFIVAGSTKIGNGFVAGGGSVVTGHIEITDHVHLAGLSGVSKAITKAGGYGGYPLQPVSDFLRTKAAIIHLQEMRKQLRRVMTHLKLSETPSVDESSSAE